MPRLSRATAALLIITALAAFTCSRSHDVTFRDAPVVLISIDTLRADHLPMYGYSRVKTPNLDALRRDAILYTSAYSHVPLTFPSHATILTGLLPQNNGVHNNIGYALDAKTPTIASMLHASGYATGAAVSAYVLRGSTGIGASFDAYDDAIENRAGTPVGALQRDGHVTATIAQRWIDSHSASPFFFFLHLFEPHSPYTPPEPFRTEYASAPYDGEIATADAIVGDVIAFLKQRGIYDRALIIVLSDHGEGLGQHGEAEHGIFLYREAIHVPLLVKLPKQQRAGESVSEPVALVDILPTIAQVTGAKPPAKLDGTSLLLPSRDAHRRVSGESLYPRIHLGWSELKSLVDDRFQFIQAPRPELYDLQRDAAETRNILDSERRVYASMRDELARTSTAAALPTHIDPEEAKKLTALGYLGSAAGTSQDAGPRPDPKDRIGEVNAMIAATELIRTHHYADAIDALRKLVAVNPDFSDAWNQLALTLEQQGRLDEAADAYRSAIRHAPQLAPEFGLSLGNVLLRLGKYDEAAEHARLGLKANAGNADILLARVAFARHDAATAEREARAARENPQSFTAASVLLAEILAQQNRSPEALSILDEAERRATAEGAMPVESLDYARGDALARMQRFDDASAAFRREIAHFPAGAEAYTHLAIIETMQGRRDNAQKLMADMVRANDTPATRQLAARTLVSLRD